MKSIVTFITVLMISSFAWAQIVTEDLLLYYKFDNNTLDETSNNFHGIANGITYTEDRHGIANGAAYFDGVNDFISLPNILDLKPELPVSFSFWVKYESTNHEDRAVFNTSFEDDRSSGIYFNTQMSTGKYAVNYGDGSYFYNSSARRTFVSDTIITNNIWHHVVATITSATEMEIYVDCKASGGTYSGSGDPLVYSLTPGNIGRNDRDLGASPLYFKGAIDDFRYYNRTLIETNVDDLCTEKLTLSDFTKNKTYIYPNPAQNEITISNNGEQIDHISIYNTFGQIVLDIPYTSKINIEHLTNGLYLAKLIGPNFIKNKKVIIKK